MTDMDVDLLSRIRQERRQRGWSMRAAAQAAGVSNTTWSRMEAGAVPITPQMSQSIATAFGWPADWETMPAETLSHPLTTVDADELLDRIRAELQQSELRIQQMLEQLKGGDTTDGNPRESADSSVRRSRSGAGAQRPHAE